MLPLLLLLLLLRSTLGYRPALNQVPDALMPSA
jgi:hypothetical protein